MLDLSGIVSDSIVDGPGIRTTFFCQGCPHHCPGCHNPETWDFGCGTTVPVEELVDVVKSNPLCRGVTSPSRASLTGRGGEAKASANGAIQFAAVDPKPMRAILGQREAPVTGGGGANE